MKIYLAPMEGITTYIYRNALHRYYGSIDRYYTPFLSNKVLSSKELRDVAPENNQGIPLVPQILTNRSDTFLQIVQTLCEFGYSEVNFNLGCPSGTVVSKKRGAGFLSVPDQLDRFLDEIFSDCAIDISIKTRIGIDSDYEWEELLSIYHKYPIKELIIHPRFQKEFYNGTPHIDAFETAVTTLADTNISLCYNGDITSYESCQTLCAKTGTPEAVMLGRGLLADPALASRLRQTADPGGPATVLSPTELSTFRAFHDEILSGYTEYMSGQQPVLFKMKELWNYMGSYVNASKQNLKKLRKAKHLSEYQCSVQAILEEYRK